VSRTIIVSDLHADTWTDRKIRSTGKDKKQHFFEFLDWCGGAGIRELIINGDLMDLPPYEGQFAFPVGQSVARDVVVELEKLASNVQVTYVFGNHDIGVSGFRSMGCNSIPGLRNVNFCYPNYVIDDYAETTILVEHGHFCDPALIFYVRDLAKRTYIKIDFEAFNWVMQRRDPQSPSTRVTPGLLQPANVQPGDNAYQVAKQDQQPLQSPSIWSRIWARLWRFGDQATVKPRMELWWREAIEEMRKYIEKTKSEGGKIKPVLYQIYGHTHRADARDAQQLPGGVSGIYINAGTWTDEVDQGWYLDVDANGKVWLQDWINEPEKLRML